MRVSIRPVVVSLLVFAGCSSDREETTTTSATNVTGVSAGETAATNADSNGDDGPVFDVAQGTGNADDGGGMGCEKVDFLFVIDNSGSMADEQQNLIANFPVFIQTIQDTLDEAQDYQIMVVDTDAWVFEGCESGPIPLCDLFAGTCGPLAPGYQCGVTMPFGCEDVLGGGVVHPRGIDASGMDCSFATGARYMDSNEPDLTGAFACAAKVGTGATSDPELPMQSMVAAVSPAGAAHDCNVGFLRDDAILVVTFITDEDDAAGDSTGTPEGWKQALVAAKSGDENAIVVLGLFGDNDQPNAICPPLDENSNAGAEPSVRLRTFVDLFGDHGVPGSVCANSYQQFFQDAVDIIDSTCEDFVPPEG